jgi:HlyD family secretion protein
MDNAMDREVARSVRRARLVRRVGVAAAVVAAVAALLVLLPGWLRPSVDRDRIRIETVDRGPVEAVLEASGTVIPAFEKVVSSPVEARVERILRRPGAAVEPGDEILELDTSSARTELDRTEDRLAQKRNELEQLRIELDAELAELGNRLESRGLDAEILRHRLDQVRQLHEQGLLSDAELRQAEVEAEKAALELRQLERSKAAARRKNAAQLRAVELDIEILEGERDAIRRRLERATTRSDRRGVVTWVVPEEGATVRRGETIARIADLDSFRVEGSVSDLHASRLAEGLPVRVLVDGEPLNGTLSAVHPTIENGVVRFTVELDEPSHPKLRNNLRADVLVVTGRERETLRVPKGPFTGTGTVFVVEGDPPARALRRDVRLGISGYDHVAVESGLREGDRVIVSDMSDFSHLDRVRIKGNRR